MKALHCISSWQKEFVSFSGVYSGWVKDIFRFWSPAENTFMMNSFHQKLKKVWLDSVLYKTDLKERKYYHSYQNKVVCK